ncbi:MAG: cyclase family protein [Asgard group archaeon]|nr:cyclase family protein [Asgard group archaeon]
MRFIDLSHIFEDSMPGLKIKNDNGTYITYSAKIHPLLTHEQTKPKYQNKASFEITEMTFPTSIGTYLDSPYHRFPDKRDISQIDLEEVILPGIVIPIHNKAPLELVNLDDIKDDISSQDISKKAILFNFNWSKFWGTEQYYDYPSISEDLIKYLIQKKVKLVGVDTVNIDNPKNLSRPAHTMFLEKEILIVENLTNLETLIGKNFRFFAVPIKGKRVAAMPIRAFAEIL